MLNLQLTKRTKQTNGQVPKLLNHSPKSKPSTKNCSNKLLKIELNMKTYSNKPKTILHGMKLEETPLLLKLKHYQTINVSPINSSLNPSNTIKKPQKSSNFLNKMLLVTLLMEIPLNQFKFNLLLKNLNNTQLSSKNIKSNHSLLLLKTKKY